MEALKSILYIDINYQKLLFHSKTGWLNFFQIIERILKKILLDNSASADNT